MPDSLTLATWNINSVRLRLPLIIEFLSAHEPDVLCLQEIKCTNDQFPAAALAQAGYPHQAVHGQKAYHGVAIISRRPLKAISKRDFCGAGDARHISAEIGFGRANATVHNFYIPAGGDEPDPARNPKFRHKLDFLAELDAWFQHPQFARRQIIAGDFNIAPHENDVWSHKQLLKVVSHTPVETNALDTIQAGRDWVDLIRRYIPPSQRLYSWWSYRARDWNTSDRGRRLDHIWATPDLAAGLTSAEVIRQARGWGEKPSDHVPVVVRLSAGLP